jgi:hypothetical protein
MEKNIKEIISYLDTAKSIYEILLKDIYIYNDNLTEFLLYYQKFDKQNDIILEILIKNIKILTELLFKSISNHLSVMKSSYGFGEKIIKPVKEEENNNIIKYNGIKKVYGTKYIQTSINVATIDNISIEKCGEKSIEGYKFSIGNIEYFLDEKWENIIKDIKKTEKFINERKNILENIEISLMTNIDFIAKYKNAFLESIK